MHNPPGLCLIVSLLLSPAHAQAVMRHGAAAGGQVTHRVRLTTDYDKSEKRTTIRIDPTASDATMEVGDGIVLSAFFRFAGEALRAPVETATLKFSSDSRDWRYINNRSLTVVVDGVDIRFGEGRVGQVAEPRDPARPGRTLYFGVSRGDLEWIAFGDVVEVKLGRKSFKLSAGQLKALQGLLARMSPGNNLP